MEKSKGHNNAGGKGERQKVQLKDRQGKPLASNLELPVIDELSRSFGGERKGAYISFDIEGGGRIEATFKGWTDADGRPVNRKDATYALMNAWSGKPDWSWINKNTVGSKFLVPVSEARKAISSFNPHAGQQRPGAPLPQRMNTGSIPAAGIKNN